MIIGYFLNISSTVCPGRWLVPDADLAIFVFRYTPIQKRALLSVNCAVRYGGGVNQCY